ncbi:MAG: 3-isopropylmalate dehydratase small subunit [Pirellulaceae bacterium]|nr:3-isopropylmalate dehydratase small subunit [Pirellulaceae bacterium]
MKPFTKMTGVVATMDRANVDTDQIIPKQFLKRIERTGFGKFLFFDWRYLDNHDLNPKFELNRPEFSGASILVTRRNFGCGSSREHAVWALTDYGFQVILAPTFADIFFNNCFNNGALPIALSEDEIETIFQKVEQNEGYQLTIDLEKQEISGDGGLSFSFEVDPFRRHCLLNGLDKISLTLEQEEKILAYEKAHDPSL